ncbi:hypothetical protein FHS83_001945 [Rhizomicrobium palustre]|uniref:Uncharacterized protein n=1 Tax=Rhizomicrobium palustre TaxID=189966 RepID=A0A846N0C2_9PROT|nr:hypothetical protein [Rhizomicrobium palustre]
MRPISSFVMAGLDPAIHREVWIGARTLLLRAKGGHDGKS